MLGWIENVFNFIFTIEIAVRLLARMNVVNHFSEPWNCFDFFIVLVRPLAPSSSLVLSSPSVVTHLGCLG